MELSSQPSLSYRKNHHKLWKVTLAIVVGLASSASAFVTPGGQSRGMCTKPFLRVRLPFGCCEPDNYCMMHFENGKNGFIQSFVHWWIVVSDTSLVAQWLIEVK